MMVRDSGLLFLGHPVDPQRKTWTRYIDACHLMPLKLIKLFSDNVTKQLSHSADNCSKWDFEKPPWGKLAPSPPVVCVKVKELKKRLKYADSQTFIVYWRYILCVPYVFLRNVTTNSSSQTFSPERDVMSENVRA